MVTDMGLLGINPDMRINPTSIPNPGYQPFTLLPDDNCNDSSRQQKNGTEQ